jgi:hypothetical protein
MTDIREMTDVHELNPAEMADVVGGDDYCGTVVTVFPIPRPPLVAPIVSVTNVLPAGLAARGTIVIGI